MALLYFDMSMFDIANHVDNGVNLMKQNRFEEAIAEFDYVCKQLRLIDALIQQANWTTELEVDPLVMEAFPVTV